MKYKKDGPDSWWRDKWNWLKSFNKVPVVKINADTISYREEDGMFIVIEGRVNVEVNVDTLMIEAEDDEEE